MGKNKSKLYGEIPGALLGTGCMIVICLSGLAALTQLVLTGKAGEKSMDLYILTLLFMATLVGSQISSFTAEKRIIGSCVSAALFIFVLTISGLILEGVFCRVLPNMGAIAAGGMVSCVLCLKKTQKGRRRKRRYR